VEDSFAHKSARGQLESRRSDSSNNTFSSARRHRTRRHRLWAACRREYERKSELLTAFPEAPEASIFQARYWRDPSLAAVLLWNAQIRQAEEEVRRQDVAG
jgi:hypothetical protein